MKRKENEQVLVAVAVGLASYIIMEETRNPMVFEVNPILASGIITCVTLLTLQFFYIFMAIKIAPKIANKINDLHLKIAAIETNLEWEQDREKVILMSKSLNEYKKELDKLQKRFDRILDF